MSASHAYAANAYRKASCAVSPIKAVVMVYDEIINTMLRLDSALDQGRSDEAFIHVQKATTLCRGLRVALDFDAGKGVAEQLDRTYGKIILALHRSFGRKNARNLYQTLMSSVLNLRNAWAGIGQIPERSPPKRR